MLTLMTLSFAFLQKQKAEEQKPSEEKIKKLKKRNAELAAIARRLEEKAKQLQLENVKVPLLGHCNRSST